MREDSYGCFRAVQHTLRIRQPALSHHLKVLAGKAALVVTRRREGNTIFYRRALWAQGRTAGLIALQVEPVRIAWTSCHCPELVDSAPSAELCSPAGTAGLARDFFRDNAHKFSRSSRI